MVSKIKVYLRQSNDQLPYFLPREIIPSLSPKQNNFFMPFEILIRIMELVLNNYKIQLEITLFLSKI